MRTKLALFAAIVLGFLAAIGVRHYVVQREADLRGSVARVAIAVARENINPGDTLREHMLKPWNVEAVAVTDMHVLFDQRGNVLGRKLTRKIRADHAIMQTDFLRPETGGEAPRKIDPGMRAVTIGTDQIAGVAGLIAPGSRVDVLGTFRIPGRGVDSAATVMLKVVARNIEVLAIDNRLETGFAATGGRRPTQYDRGYSSVTLLVYPLEASLLTFAQSAGKLSFTLRRTEDGYGKEPIPDITLQELDALIASTSRQRAEKDQIPKPPTTP